MEIWSRGEQDAAYRRPGIEQVAALLEAGMPMLLSVDGCDRRVTVDKAEHIAGGMPAVGRLWVTEA